MYGVRIKESAIEVNPAVANLAEEEGTRLTFRSKGEAEELASECSESGGRVRIQRVAKQDPDEVNAYLISDPRRFVSEPKESNKRGLTFDVGANQFGEIGRAVTYGTYGLSPGLKYYFEREIDDFDPKHDYLRVVAEPYLHENIPDEVTWSPDCLIIVQCDFESRKGLYYCEIKAGDASFERSQQEDMKTVANYHNALKIRVDLEGLPDEYTFRVNEVGPD